jgi:TusE/DsrC/DsvC family sulfur relay protein
MSALAAVETLPAMTAEGYLQNADDWTPELANQLALQAGISLTDDHWKVIDFCRQDYAARGEAPGIRRITKVGGVPTKQIYKLFPGGPGKLAARISGLPKPTSCV